MTKRICSLPGCRRKHKARGLCDTHCRQSIRRNRPPCRISGCDKPQFQTASQLCERTTGNGFALENLKRRQPRAKAGRADEHIGERGGRRPGLETASNTDNITVTDLLFLCPNQVLNGLQPSC